jgi:hypothetical protein
MNILRTKQIPTMKKIIIILFLPLTAVSQQIEKKIIVPIATVNTQPAGVVGIYPGSTQGQVAIYVSQLAQGSIKNEEATKTDLGVKLARVNRALVPGSTTKEMTSGLPMVTENILGDDLAPVSQKSEIISPVPFFNGMPYTFVPRTAEFAKNETLLKYDIENIKNVFPSFADDFSKTTVGGSIVGEGRGLLGNKDVKYFPASSIQQLQFGIYAYAMAIPEPKPLQKDLNKEKLGTLKPKFTTMQFYPTAGILQGVFFDDKDDDKYGEFRHYQFINFDTAGNIASQEDVKLPFAYDPKAYPVKDENGKAAGVLYFFTRADVSKKAQDEKVNKYLFCFYGTDGKKQYTTEALLGEDENEVILNGVFMDAGKLYCILQNEQKKTKSLIISQLTATGLTEVEKLTEESFTPANCAGNKLSFGIKNLLLVKGVHKDAAGNINIFGQGFTTTKILGMKVENYDDIFFMKFSPQLKFIKEYTAVNTLYNMLQRQTIVEILDEFNGKIVFSISGNNVHAGGSVGDAGLILGPALYSNGMSLNQGIKNDCYDKSTRKYFVVNLITNNYTFAEVFKVNF